MIRVSIKPEMFRWARQRARISQDNLATKFNKLHEWEKGQTQPTLKQVEAFARTLHVPVGYLFLSEPPIEVVPIPDFRTPASHAVAQPSPNLLDTIYTCQERQMWYRNHARVMGEPTLDFVNSVSTEESAESVAAQIKERLSFDVSDRRNCSTWTAALRMFIRQTERTGILVMVSGIVKSNSHRTLDPNEFRGFALCDSLAPLIFINGKDAKAAQMFTLAHELAHIWLGASALSNLGIEPKMSPRSEELWCNAVAAELLVPLNDLKSKLWRNESLHDTLYRLARLYKVSRMVILRRLLDAGYLTRDRFDDSFAKMNATSQKSVQANERGDFHLTTISRVGRRFAGALVVSTLEGQTLYRDAFRMLGIKKTATFNSLGREIGVME